jgi:hypothetical protein
MQSDEELLTGFPLRDAHGETAPMRLGHQTYGDLAVAELGSRRALAVPKKAIPRAFFHARKSMPYDGHIFVTERSKNGIGIRITG